MAGTPGGPQAGDPVAIPATLAASPTAETALGRPARLGIVGLGLLGASLAEAARKRWPTLGITGISSPATLEKAKRAGLIDEGLEYSRIDQALADCDLLILCTPIDHILGILENWAQVKPAGAAGCIVTDVGSTKTAICALGARAFPRGGATTFVGSHPMAGSEKTGLEARDALLFQNASWVICPPALETAQGFSDTAATSSATGTTMTDSDVLKVQLAVQKVEAFAKALGARTTRMAPDLHDLVAAHVSHLPQLLATALASYTGEKRNVVENCLQIAGGGFRDMTRLAASSFSVWEPILNSNRDSIHKVLSGFRAHLAALDASLEANLGAGFFREGNQLRGRLTTGKKGFVAALAEILVDLEDKPGVLVRVFEPLAKRGLNVLDVEILKVREGEGGTLMLGFHGGDDAQAALQALSAAGFQARLR